MNKSLEDILKSKYGLSDEDYADAVRLHDEKGDRLPDVLLRRKVISETQLLDALSDLYDLPFWPELPLESFGEESYTQCTHRFSQTPCHGAAGAEEHPGGRGYRSA